MYLVEEDTGKPLIDYDGKWLADSLHLWEEDTGELLRDYDGRILVQDE